MKRFWTAVESQPEADGFAIVLDGKPLRLPGGTMLRVQGRAMAAAVADEWQAIEADFTWDLLPLTRLVGTAQDRIAPDPAPVVAALAAYGETDLLCYRAEDPRLAARQATAWDPMLEWVAERLGAPLRATVGVMPVAQDAASLDALRAVVTRQDAWALAGLGVMVPALGSLVLGLAVAEGLLAPAEAVAAAHVDEVFQQEFWGLDDDAAIRAAGVSSDVALAARFLVLSRMG